MEALFDENDHCVSPGWATYGLAQSWRRRIHRRHRTSAPTPPNDYCPASMSRCDVCDVALSYFDVGRHRFGSYRKHVFDAYQARRLAGTEHATGGRP